MYNSIIALPVLPLLPHRRKEEEERGKWLCCATLSFEFEWYRRLCFISFSCPPLLFCSLSLSLSLSLSFLPALCSLSLIYVCHCCCCPFPFPSPTHTHTHILPTHIPTHECTNASTRYLCFLSTRSLTHTYANKQVCKYGWMFFPRFSH